MKLLNRRNLLFVLLTLLSIFSCQAGHKVMAQSTPDWFKRIGKSYQGEFWKNGKIAPGSTLFYLSNQTGLTGIYITGENGNYLTGDLYNCQAKQERTIHCQWREPNQTGEFEATFSADFLSFKGFETVTGAADQHPWQGSRDRSSAAVFP